MEMTADYLRSILSYDPATGEFRWLVSLGRRVKIGDVAGHDAHGGYRRVKIGGRPYFAHRLAWLYVHGRWPIAEIDHIDTYTGNNAIANLREATNPQNMKNRKRQANNTSGFKGVTWNTKDRAWRAQIKVGGRQIHLGTYRCPEIASRAYAEAASKLHGEFARTD